MLKNLGKSLFGFYIILYNFNVLVENLEFC